MKNLKMNLIVFLKRNNRNSSKRPFSINSLADIEIIIIKAWSNGGRLIKMHWDRNLSNSIKK